MNQILNLTAALNQPDKTSCDIVAVLEKSETKTGKRGAFYNLKLRDVEDGRNAYGNAFIPYSPHELEGRTVLLSGVEIGTFNGRKNFTIGSKGTIGEYHADLEPTPRSTSPQPQGGVLNRPSSQAPSQSQGNASSVHPATAGMAVKCAVDIWMSERGTDSFGGNATERIASIAHSLILISQSLERGENPNAESSPPF